MKVLVIWMNKRGETEILPLGENPNILYGEIGWVPVRKVEVKE